MPVGLLYLHFTQLETLEVFWKQSQNQMIQTFESGLINFSLITQLTTEKNNPKIPKPTQRMSTESIVSKVLFNPISQAGENAINTYALITVHA